MRALAAALGLLALFPACGDDAAGCADAAPTPDATPPLCTGGYHVCGGFLRDPDGRAVILRGANLAGAHKQAPYLAWHQPADYARLKTDWGLDAIRFLITWAAVEPQPGVYDDAYLDQVATRMQWAQDAGLLVVVDMHQDVYGEGFASGGGDGAPLWSCDQANYDAFVPQSSWFLNYGAPQVIACFDHLWNDDATQAHLVAAWRHVAERLAGSPAVIGFDALNEPYWGSASPITFERDVLEPYYLRVTSEVRAAAPGWVAFLEPAASRNLGVATSLAPFGVADVVYAPHAYDSTAEQGSGFDDTRRQAYLDNVAALADEAHGLGTALWIGEYGGYGTGLEAYMDAAYDAAATAAAGNTLWSYDKGGSYSMLNADDSENGALLANVVRPYPMRVAGDPVGWQYADATGVFTFTLRPDARVTAPTVISLPPRLYPNGYDVACGGCTATPAAGAVELTDLPASDSLTITVSPR